MEFRLRPHEERLRTEVCEFLSAALGTGHNSDPMPMPPGYMPAREFELKLGAKGWLGISWPVEYGGGGRPVSEQFIVEEEIALHGGPASDAIARIIVAPILLAAGSEAQKRAYLPRLARGEITFCLGYTEPESGSDLASLQTRAVREGDDYVINGRKLYTSGAESSEYCWLAARTKPDSTKHAGVSVFIVPMDAPGVEVRPLINVLDEPWFNEVAFENVRVPVPDRVGQENSGWQVLTSALGIERITIYRPFLHWRALMALVRQVRTDSNGSGTLGDAAPARQALAQLTIDFEVARLLLHRAVQMHSAGIDYRAQAAMCKVFNTELAQRIYVTGIGILGPYGYLLDSHLAPWDGAIAHGLLSSVQDTIGAGTSEVQREIIALRGLGLPRG